MSSGDYRFKVINGGVNLKHDIFNCDHKILGEVYTFDDAELAIRSHERKWHQAKIIKIHK